MMADLETSPSGIRYADDRDPFDDQAIQRVIISNEHTVNVKRQQITHCLCGDPYCMGGPEAAPTVAKLFKELKTSGISRITEQRQHGPLRRGIHHLTRHGINYNVLEPS